MFNERFLAKFTSKPVEFSSTNEKEWTPEDVQNFLKRVNDIFLENEGKPVQFRYGKRINISVIDVE